MGNGSPSSLLLSGSHYSAHNPMGNGSPSSLLVSGSHSDNNSEVTSVNNRSQSHNLSSCNENINTYWTLWGIGDISNCYTISIFNIKFHNFVISDLLSALPTANRKPLQQSHVSYMEFNMDKPSEPKNMNYK